jgi:hypothetical protein
MPWLQSDVMAAGQREVFLSEPSFAKRRLSILDPHVICSLYTMFD